MFVGGLGITVEIVLVGPGIALSTTLEGALCVPLVVYAVTAKYHVPLVRLLTM